MNKKFDQKLLFNEILKVNLVIDPTISKASMYGQLGHLLRAARLAIPAHESIKTKVRLLLTLFYDEWGFRCDPERYFYSSNLLLPQVFKKREGMPASLGAILLYLAEGLNLPIYPVHFPTQLILRVDTEDEVAFIDPWRGEYLSYARLQTWLEGYLGFGHFLSKDHLQIATEESVKERISQVLKNALIREGENQRALDLIEWKLKMNPDDPYEIRDRGLVLANLECMHAALSDFDYFIEKCPDDPSALLLKTQMSEFLNQHYSIH